MFTNRDYEFYKNLYTCYVISVLGSSTQVWSPMQKGNFDRVESVQRYCIRQRVRKSKKILSYPGRSNRLRLKSLKLKRAE